MNQIGLGKLKMYSFEKDEHQEIRHVKRILGDKTDNLDHLEFYAETFKGFQTDQSKFRHKENKELDFNEDYSE